DEATRTTFRTFDGLIVTATSFERDGEQWVRFDAGVAAEGADGGEASTGSGEASTDGGDATADGGDAGADDGAEADDAGPEAAADAGEEDAGVDVRDEAERINARVAGWEYQIPSYLFGQLTRRTEDLLRAVEDDAAE